MEERDRRTVVELDRCGCKHCDRAEEEVRRLCERYGAVAFVRRVDREEWLKDLAGWKTPIVYVGGRLVSQVEVSPKKWDAAVRGEAAHSPFEIAGEVIDLECHLKDESRGERHVRCATECLERGEPAGLLTPNGQVFLLLPSAEDREKLVKLAGREVTVKGRVYRKGGVQAVAVEAIL